jgi:coenzyme F420-reducing hydrogenase beta subunit
MLKIGILTLFHGNMNWGGVLQGYALKTLLSNTYKNAQVDLLIYHDGYSVVYPSVWKQLLQYSPTDIVRQGLKRFVRQKTPSIAVRMKNRKQLFEDFTAQCTTNTKQYTKDSLISAARKYDCLICGSDQIWNPNVARPGYFLETVTDECIKISYAASIARNDLSKHEREVMIPLIARFDAISVREKTAKTILERYLPFGKIVTETLDPVLMLPRSEWDKLVRDVPPDKEKYALVFFFSESYAYRKHIAAYCQAHSLRLKFIPFAMQKYMKSDEQGTCDRLYDVGPREFVHLFRDAQCVFTDSFHGSVYSILFQKPFGVFERDKQNKVSKNSRLYDLLEKFNLSGRLVRDVGSLETVMQAPVDYDTLENLLNTYRKLSLAFLTNSIGLAFSTCASCEGESRLECVTVADIPRAVCCGCSLCAAVCPKECIRYEPDEEGFTYPVVEVAKCVRCGACLLRCVGYRPDSVRHDTPRIYLGFHKQPAVREKSSSGGIFHALASNVLANGGVIYGAAMDNAFQVHHIRVDQVAGLMPLMASKYVQSNLREVYPLLLKDLIEGLPVLFSGTPCQVGAIKRMADRETLGDALILVDFVCHGVPSPGIWKSYMQYLLRKGPIREILFRSKVNGWHDYHFAVTYAQNKHFSQSHELDPFMRSFLSNKNIRPSCYECSYKGDFYASDITLADAWKIEKNYPAWADDKGTSLIIVRTEKGAKLFNEIANSIEMRPTDYSKWAGYNPSLISATSEPSSRSAFFKAYRETETVIFWQMQSKIPVKKRVHYLLKQVLHKTGLGKAARRKF